MKVTVYAINTILLTTNDDMTRIVVILNKSLRGRILIDNRRFGDHVEPQKLAHFFVFWRLGVLAIPMSCKITHLVTAEIATTTTDPLLNMSGWNGSLGIKKNMRTDVPQFRETHSNAWFGTDMSGACPDDGFARGIKRCYAYWHHSRI